MSRRRKPEVATIPADHLMVIAAFRYCLGRQTYIVRSCAEWLHRHWQELPQGTRDIIARDLDEAFDADDAARAANAPHKPLGDDCDRNAWAWLRRKYRPSVCCQCGRECQDELIGVVHLDGEVSCETCHEDKCVVCKGELRVGEQIRPVGRKFAHPGCAS